MIRLGGRRGGLESMRGYSSFGFVGYRCGFFLGFRVGVEGFGE